MDGNRRNYFLVALISAIGGGFIAVLVTEAIPKMMSKMMRNMMQNMMASMGELGCDPAEM